MKKELTYKNLIKEITIIKNIKIIFDNEFNNYDIFYQNKEVGYFELNINKKEYELICIDKNFFNYIDKNFFWLDGFIVWDWTKDEKSNIHN